MNANFYFPAIENEDFYMTAKSNESYLKMIEDGNQVMIELSKSSPDFNQRKRYAAFLMFEISQAVKADN